MNQAMQLFGQKTAALSRSSANGAALARGNAKPGETAITTVDGQVVYLTLVGSPESNVVLDAPQFRPLAHSAAKAYARMPTPPIGSLIDLYI